MKHIKPPLLLMIFMMMAPQILETLYSPALTAISADYTIPAEKASQTLSVYFISFAFGVAFWGRFSDQLGRRLAMLSGLFIYLIGAILALTSSSFLCLLGARIIVAFGAAVGSVITQTMMRDSYDGVQLGKVFATMGIALSVSPIIGMVSGGVLAHLGGSSLVFIGQLLFALCLFCWCWRSLPETLINKNIQKKPLMNTLSKMLKDPHIWLTVTLIALFNVMIYSYYSLAPFIFERLGFNSQQFGYSGAILALGSLGGALLNKRFIHHGIAASNQIIIGVLLAIFATFLLNHFQHSLMLLLPCALVMVAFGLAIPNILSQALTNYPHELGTAGALLGLWYYLLIGGGLMLSGMGQNLVLTLALCSSISLVGSLLLKKLKR